MDKIKIGFLPVFSFEAAFSVFFNSEKFDIVPIEVSGKDLKSEFAQELYGDWCAPLKQMVASYEKAVVKNNVNIIIGFNYNFCRYPFVLGDLSKWIKKDFSYYPIKMDSINITPPMIYAVFNYFKKIIPNFSLTQFLKLLPKALKKKALADEFKAYYLKHLPLSKNPQFVRKNYIVYRNKFIDYRDDLKKSKKILKEFKSLVEETLIHKKPLYRILISGDAEVIAMEFSLFELDCFLAKHRAEIIQATMNYKVKKLEKLARGAKKIISRIFSNNNNRIDVSQRHQIETATLFHILQGIDKEVDGIIFIKPNMCSPCENVGFILKEEEYFGVPMVEISYDEHSGTNGIITRIEAFLNIIKEKKGPTDEK